MNQEFKFKTAQNSKNLRLNGHTLQPSSRPREPYTKIHKHGLNHGIMTYL